MIRVTMRASPPHPVSDTPGTLDAPEGLPVMHQCWNHLLFLHWAESSERLRPLLPRGLELDDHQGTTYIGVVGFLMEQVRPRGLPALPWLSFFRELNVRLYVRDRWGRPGVHFLSLDCDRAVAVWIARTCFSLPYRHATMDFGTAHGESTLTCQRRGTRLGPAVYSWSPASPPLVSEPGTVEFHLLERYRFFTERRGRLQEGRVRHAPYMASSARLSGWSALPLAWNGLPLPERPPDLAHCCRGVAVEAHALRGLTETPTSRGSSGEPAIDRQRTDVTGATRHP